MTLSTRVVVQNENYRIKYDACFPVNESEKRTWLREYELYDKTVHDLITNRI